MVRAPRVYVLSSCAQLPVQYPYLLSTENVDEILPQIIISIGRQNLLPRTRRILQQVAHTPTNQTSYSYQCSTCRV